MAACLTCNSRACSTLTYSISCPNMRVAFRCRCLVPPRLQGLFLERAIAEHRAGRVSEVVLLLNVAIGQKWFTKVFDYAHCFLADKPLKPQTAPPPGWGVPRPESAAALVAVAAAAALLGPGPADASELSLEHSGARSGSGGGNGNRGGTSGTSSKARRSGGGGARRRRQRRRSADEDIEETEEEEDLELEEEVEEELQVPGPAAGRKRSLHAVVLPGSAGEPPAARPRRSPRASTRPPAPRACSPSARLPVPLCS
mgnify:CR=1 FL=1